jgi:hyperosmotically inducible periplasmic protein
MNRNTMKSLAIAAMAVATLLTAPPARASETDDRIESSFKKSYVYRTYLKDDSIKISSKNGMVTLTGSAIGDLDKTLAADTAAGLPGVGQVNNQIETKAEAAAEKSDKWIVRKIDLALLFHRNVNAHRTTVAAKDGVVTLTGEAMSAAQKDLTGEYASDIEGVKEVKNDLAVVASSKPERTTNEKMDDASITAQVKMALMTHRSTSSTKTSVETRNGEVWLTGVAKNAAEKALVSKLTADIQGVTSFKNEMTLEPSKVN